ncbi:iron-regulated protein A precursor [Colwellia sp. MB02u-10]|uniref:imelysin family protein n=1 Tax=Colwellia sp. MB02u-10 TaxID=2759828 RepID=UPI0015F755BD|nr:imelysin family protein [Colwellia sp. MB02u-10]MBA6339528.1 iron-regulated protein A precursor [Colwellia sp. MB02u-10]
MYVKKSLVAATLSAIILSACGGSSSEAVREAPVINNSFTFSATEMITNLTNDVIVAGYLSLSTEANKYHLATLTLFNSPTAENLAAAQQAWRDVRIPWEQGEAHIFGPVDALSIDPHLDTWPLNTSDLQALLASQSGFTAEQVKLFNDDVQGFHTMEFLLFGDGLADNEKTIDEMTPLEREYLVATAEVFNEYAQSLADAWTVSYDPSHSNSPAYKELLLTANNNVYASELGVIEELIQGMIGIIDEVGNGKIAEPFGTSLSTTDTSLVESQYSWNSLADFADNIQGVQNVFRGEFINGADKQGIIDFVAAADSELASRMNNQINDALTAIQAIKGEDNLPFRQAINDADARLRIQGAIESLSLVQTSFERDVLPLLAQWHAN